MLDGAARIVYSRASLRRRSGRVVEGTPLLREHTGTNLYRGFESLLLRQLRNC